MATAIRGITDSASKVKSLVDEVNEASKQQTQGIGEVAAAVVQVSRVTQTAAASAEESAAAAQELSAQSNTVPDLVQQLEALVGATEREERAPRRPHEAPQPAASWSPAASAHRGRPVPDGNDRRGSFRSF